MAAVHMSQASHEAFAALTDMLESFMSNPVVLGFSQDPSDFAAGAEVQFLVDELAMAFHAAGVEVPPLLAEAPVEEEPLAELPPLEEVPSQEEAADPEHPLNVGFAEVGAEEDADDDSDGFDPEAINCDLSTVYQDEEEDDNGFHAEYNEVMAGNGIPGVFINIVQEARPLLAFVRSQDIPNVIQNGFYFDLKGAISWLMSIPSVISLWRLHTGDALAHLLPHLAAEHHGLVTDLMHRVEESMEVAESWVLQNLGPDNRLEGFPLARYYYFFYLRRHLRYRPEDVPHGEVDEADEADGQADGLEESIPLLAPEAQVA